MFTQIKLSYRRFKNERSLPSIQTDYQPTLFPSRNFKVGLSWYRNSAIINSVTVKTFLFPMITNRPYSYTLLCAFPVYNIGHRDTRDTFETIIIKILKFIFLKIPFFYTFGVVWRESKGTFILEFFSRPTLFIWQLNGLWPPNFWQIYVRECQNARRKSLPKIS